MDASWQPLRSAGLPPSCPPLFTKCRFASSSYAIFLTDLSHVWKENMDRKSIFKRALLEETPIDPAEDAGQMQLLLKHIRSAIDAEKGTRRQLIRNAKDPATLSLHLTTPLPGSLGDLQWIVHFESLQPASLRQHLISPLMSRVYNQKQQVNDLVSQLNAKDHIISKLLDKLEGSGVEIASVFPGAAGARSSKHITSREQAARQVHGLGAFDYQEWQQSQNADKSLQLSQENLAEVLKISDFHEDADESKDAGFQWLAALPSTISEASSKDKDATPAPDTEGDVTMDEDVTAADEDIFERQDTPPRLKKSKSQQILSNPGPSNTVPQAASHDDEEETTDDEDLNAPSSQPPVRVQVSTFPPSPPVSFPKTGAPALSQKPKRLGKLGGKASNPPPEQSPIDAPVAGNDATTGSETEDENGADASKPSDFTEKTTASTTEQPAKEPIHKGKLGVIGGKKTRASASRSASSTPARQSSPDLVPAPNRVRSKLGGRGNTGAPTDASAEAGKPNAAVRSESPDAHREQKPSTVRNSSSAAPSGPPESEQERANRKREELKRELEKSQGPKKKRKF